MRNLQFPELPIQWSENGYEITEELGHGSYGSVYKLVKDKGTENEEVSALKIINWTLDNNTVRYEFTKDWDEARKSYAQRFDQMTQEVNLLESFVGMKTIVQLKGSCTEKMPELNYWKLYIQMEYLKDLMDFADECNGLTRKQIVKLGIDICNALEVCHAKNIIHRDIKPANIMVSPKGYFKLGDFGLAREWDDGSMTVIGTRNYMAPEVYNTFYDKSADIYSLGMVLYYFANDMRLPFWDLHDSVAQMNARCKGELPEPKTAFEPLRRIILKACAFEPKDRYQSAADMRADLENAKSIGNKEKEIRKYV